MADSAVVVPKLQPEAVIERGDAVQGLILIGALQRATGDFPT
jgi:hypothetical protein